MAATFHNRDTLRLFVNDQQIPVHGWEALPDGIAVELRVKSPAHADLQAENAFLRQIVTDCQTDSAGYQRGLVDGWGKVIGLLRKIRDDEEELDLQPSEIGTETLAEHLEGLLEHLASVRADCLNPPRVSGR